MDSGDSRRKIKAKHNHYLHTKQEGKLLDKYYFSRYLNLANQIEYYENFLNETQNAETKKLRKEKNKSKKKDKRKSKQKSEGLSSGVEEDGSNSVVEEYLLNHKRHFEEAEKHASNDFSPELDEYMKRDKRNSDETENYDKKAKSKHKSKGLSSTANLVHRSKRLGKEQKDKRKEESDGFSPEVEEYFTKHKRDIEETEKHEDKFFSPEDTRTSEETENHGGKAKRKHKSKGLGLEVDEDGHKSVGKKKKDKTKRKLESSRLSFDTEKDGLTNDEKDYLDEDFNFKRDKIIRKYERKDFNSEAKEYSPAPKRRMVIHSDMKHKYPNLYKKYGCNVCQQGKVKRSFFRVVFNCLLAYCIVYMIYEIAYYLSKYVLSYNKDNDNYCSYYFRPKCNC